MALTQQLITRLKPDDKPYEVRDDKMKGFLVRVQPSGVMSFVIQYARGKRITLGDARVLTLDQARTKAKEILGQVAAGSDPQKERRPKSGPLTLCQFLTEHYQEWIANHHRHDDNLNRIRASFADLLDTPLTEIIPWTIERHRKTRKDSGIAASTINRDVAALRAALNRAVDWSLIESNPLKPLKQIKTDKTGVIRYLDPAEEARLLAALDNLKEGDRLRPMVLVSLHTGLRWGELAGLYWKDIDLTNRRLTVRGEGAKSKQTRHVPLNDTAHSALLKWRGDLPRMGLVFPGKAGVLDNVRKSWASLLQAAEIEEFRWHDLRHHFASKLVQAGIDLNTVRELLGHQSMQMTLRYAHLAPEHRAAAVARIG
jgi:integrase